MKTKPAFRFTLDQPVWLNGSQPGKFVCQESYMHCRITLDGKEGVWFVVRTERLTEREPA